MKWIIILLLIAATAWVYFNVDFNKVYFNVDFNKVGDETENVVKQEKTLKKFFDADNQNKQETQQTINEHF